MKIVSSCPLCEAHALHIIGQDDYETQQCISCGYATSKKFKLDGKKRQDNEEYQKLTDDMKNWSYAKNDHLWIPTVMTLPLGMLYPLNVDNMVKHETELKWAFAPMIDITKEEQENYPNGQGGFYTKRIDTDNPKIYDTFLEGMAELNDNMKKQSETKPGIKLPKLKKIDGTS